MERNKEETKIRAMAVSSILPSVLIVGMVLFSFVKPVFGPHVDPLDIGIDKQPRIAAEEIVVDSTNNGFRAVYVTRENVTPARFDEIISRPHIRLRLDRLKHDAPVHFGGLLYVDIYDFTVFAQRYHPDPDLYLHNVFVFGREKSNLYIGPNPKIDNPAKWIDFLTLQGVLYIGAEEISHYASDSVRVYKYWRCRFPHKRSDTDEHFSHFSEDDRLCE